MIDILCLLETKFAHRAKHKKSLEFQHDVKVQRKRIQQLTFVVEPDSILCNIYRFCEKSKRVFANRLTNKFIYSKSLFIMHVTDCVEKNIFSGLFIEKLSIDKSLWTTGRL